ncbi:hypothetical protein RS030_81383 [Cryptosporidium xiaoi]|uniref:Protein kinase domain-containing protein n=1 Tax=Cryptosporidium xiaoi TaxID=659607 RepID=A0AAV9XSU1_9CRYT
MRRGFLKGASLKSDSTAEKHNVIKKDNVDKYEILELLGTGNFTKVFRGFDKINKIDVAIKVAEKSRLISIRKEDEILNEKKICMMINDNPSKNVVKLLSTFSDDENLYLVYELCTGGELWEKILPIGLRPLTQAKFFLAQLLISIEHIHNLGIIHRDIKAENCFITEEGWLKLGDFGSSITINETKCSSTNCNSSCECRFLMRRGRREFKYYVGTPQFMPPESIRNKPPTKAVDLWSFGCTVFQVISGYPPYNAPSEFLVYCRILGNKLVFPPDFPEDAKSLVELLLRHNPEERPNIEKIKKHKFFEQIDFGRFLSEENFHFICPPTLKDICLISISKTGKKFEEDQISRLKASESVMKSIKRISFDLERNIYEGPRDSWIDEFPEFIKNDFACESDGNTPLHESSE